MLNRHIIGIEDFASRHTYFGSLEGVDQSTQPPWIYAGILVKQNQNVPSCRPQASVTSPGKTQVSLVANQPHLWEPGSHEFRQPSKKGMPFQVGMMTEAKDNLMTLSKSFSATGGGTV
jgi:hypothetical protein